MFRLYPFSWALAHGCPFWLIWSKNRGPWFTWNFNQLPGPSTFPKRTPMLCLQRDLVANRSLYTLANLGKRGWVRVAGVPFPHASGWVSFTTSQGRSLVRFIIYMERNRTNYEYECQKWWVNPCLNTISMGGYIYMYVCIHIILFGVGGGQKPR